MAVSFDGTEAKQGGGGLLPAGAYTGRVRYVIPFRANSGSKGLEVLLEVDAGPNAGSTIKDSLWLEKDGGPSKALPFSKWAIECTGAALPAGSFEVDEHDEKCAALCRAMVGARVAFVVGMEADRNDPAKEWPRVKSWEKVAKAGASGMPADPVGGAPVGKAADDDIPF